MISDFFEEVIYFVLLMFFLLLCFLIFIAMDSCFGKKNFEIDNVRFKYYKSGYMTYVNSGKSVVPVYHPESYNIELKELNQTCEVEKSEYDSLKEGDTIKVKVSKSSFFGVRYVLNCKVKKIPSYRRD